MVYVQTKECDIHAILYIQFLQICLHNDDGDDDKLL